MSRLRVESLTGIGGASPPVDARLVPATLVVWLGCCAGLLLEWWCAVLVGVAGALAGVWLLGLRRWDRAAALALLGCGLLTAGWLAAGLHAVAVHPLRASADEHASAQVRIEPTSRPKPVRGPGNEGGSGSGATVMLRARVLAGRVDAEAVPASADVVVFAPQRSWGGVLLGQSVTAYGTLAPSGRADTTVAVLRVRGPPADRGAAAFGQRSAESIRTGLHQHSKVLGPEAGGLLPGLVDGDTSALPPRVESDFRTAGLTHLTAVSGTHLGIVCGAVLLLARGLRAGPRLAAAVAGLALAGFVLLAGPEPSVLRAAVMGAIALLAMALGRNRSALPALATAVVVLVCFDPAMAVNLGFTLSVLATAALVLLAPRWTAWLQARSVPARFAQAVVVPTAAHLVTAPVIAGISGKVSVVAVAANLLVGPVVAPAMLFGVLAAVTAPWFPWLAGLLVRFAGPEVHWIVKVGTTGAHLPGAAFGWPAGWLGAGLLAGLIVVIVVGLRYRRPRILVLTALLVLCVVTVPPRLLQPGWPPRGWAMVGCDVGQGDASVLATADRTEVVLVDVGPDNGAVGDCLRRLGVRTVSMVLLSHLHDDHYGGLRTVLDGWPVGAVAVGPSHEPSRAWRAVRAIAGRDGVPVVGTRRGGRLNWPGLAVDVLGPLPAEREPAGDGGTEINNTSVVLRANTPAGRVLLTGDVEPEAQADLRDTGTDLRAEVLKIPHHGSRAQRNEFLRAVHARVAIASAGKGNDYGHPNPGTLRVLRDRGALVQRTDHDGDVAVLPGQARSEDVRVAHRGHPRLPP